MRDDLKTLVPWFADKELLLCPTCCRALRFEDFSLEHMIPQQAISEDPAEVRTAINRNERSGTTLLCQIPLYVAGQLAHPLGCNNWKGKFYDPFIRKALRSLPKDFSQRHHIALFSACYLGAVERFGYQIALSPTGLIMRRQFFSPNAWLKDVPDTCQMMLAGEEVKAFSEEMRSYWSEPFKFAMNGDKMVVVVRSLSVQLPMYRDPAIPLARAIPYAPPRYKLKPDLSTVFN